MRGPDVYPELILDSVQEEIRALERQRARETSRKAAGAARRSSLAGLVRRWRRRVTRRPAAAP